MALDVVSVRENPKPALDFSIDMRFLPGRLDIVNMPVESLVAYAEGVRAEINRDRLIVGWPNDGIRLKRFDISATLRGSSKMTENDQRRLVRDLLVQRFGFQSHREPRRMGVYALTLVKNGVLGKSLHRIDFACDAVSRADPSRRKVCRESMELIPGGVRYGGAGSISEIIVQLQRQQQRLEIVTDATGLEGNFIWELELPTAPSGPPDPFAVRGEPSRRFLDALRDQLGLKVERKNASVPVVVIDAISLPTPN